MRHLAPSTSSLDSDSADDASTRQSDSSLDTPPASAPQSRRSSLKSDSKVSSARQSQRTSLKSSLKTSRSAPALAVRFSMPEPLPNMPGVEPDAPVPQCKDVPLSPAKVEPPTPSKVPPEAPARPPLREKLSKRFSAPVASRKEVNKTSAPSVPPVPIDPRTSSGPLTSPGSRVTSFQSTASAPAALQSTPSPSGLPSQYNPLQHYIPCLAPNCRNHYTHSLLGPTFYSAQQPYQLIRKRGICPLHASQDLKLANQKAKHIWESMRQNAGRKTLGLIAAEFEVWVQRSQEDRAEESEALELAQERIVLGKPWSKSKSGKKGKDEKEGEWKYAPRPCTKKGCATQWYSPYDNRLFLFYQTPRPSGLSPLHTLCPTCARADVESAEDRIEGRREEAGAGPEWAQWCEQVKNDRIMEQEFWEKAQERFVREKGIAWPGAVLLEQKRTAYATAVKAKKKGDRMKGICAVM